MADGDQITITDMDNKSTIEGVMDGLIGKPPAATPDPSTPPAPKPAEGAKPPDPAPGPAQPPEGVVPVPAPATPPPAEGDSLDLEAINKVDVKTLDPKIQVNFAKMRDKLNGTIKDGEGKDAEIAELKKQLADRPAAPEEMQKKWDEEKAEMLDRIARVNLEADPRFVAKYEYQRKPVVETLKAALAGYQIEGLNVDAAIDRLAAVPPHDRITMLQQLLPEELANAAMSTILPIFSNLDMVEANRRVELDNHKLTMESLGKEQQAAEEGQLLRIRDEAKTKAIASTAESEFVMKRVDGQDDWNKGIDAIEKNIATIFASTNPEVHAKALAESQLMPVYKALYVDAYAKMKHYEDAMKARNITIPTMSGKSDPPAKTPKKISGMTMDDITARVVAKASGQ